jgi:glutaredoxin
VKAKSLLRELNIDYDEMIVSPGFGETAPELNQRYVTRDDLLAKLPSARTVPQIWIDGVYIGGCTELEAAIREGHVTGR